MSLHWLASAHGSPGVTTTALALAASWPAGRQCLLVEADPFGGVISSRYGLGDSPGLSSLAAVARRDLDEEVVWDHAQVLPGGLPVLIGPASADEAIAVLRDLVGPLVAWASHVEDVDVVVDCGRLGPKSPIGPLLSAGPGMVLSRPTLEQLRPAALRLAALQASGIEGSMLLVGDTPYGPAEVTAALAVPVAGVIAWDPRTAAVLTGSGGKVRDLRRSLLVRSVATLANQLAQAPAAPERSARRSLFRPAAEVHFAEEAQS